VPVIDDDTYGCQQVNVHEQRANSYSLWHSIRRMIQVRKEYPAFGRGEFEWIDCENDAIAAYTRTFEGQIIYVFNNLSAGEQTITIPFSSSIQQLTDLLTDKTYPVKKNRLALKLGPRQYLWLI
jgi:maltose alpha-D-glucosyltransferase/alpha-amylase